MITNIKHIGNPFKKGDRVRYIPNHAHGDSDHEHCENGIVSSISNDNNVFVKYDNGMGIMVTGDEPYTSKRTCISNLVKRAGLEIIWLRVQFRFLKFILKIERIRLRIRSKYFRIL